MESFEVPVFAQKYEQMPRDPSAFREREAYLASEIKRVRDAGEGVLTAILAQVDRHACKTEALELLKRGITRDGEPLETPRTFALRLTKTGAALTPPRDPNGVDAPKGVLVAKIGVVGADSPNDETVGRLYDAQHRRQLQVQRRLYKTAKVTKEPTPFDLETAVAILQAWGNGIAVRNRLSSSDERRGIKSVQETWLVEEVAANAQTKAA